MEENSGAIQKIIENLMDSEENWFSLVYHRPSRSLTYITTSHYFEEDEPGYIEGLQAEKRKIIEEFDRSRENFIFFPRLSDEERSAVITDFINTLNEPVKSILLNAWKNQSEHILSNWRMGSVYRLFSENEYKIFQSFLFEKYSSFVYDLLDSNHISIKELEWVNL